MNNENDKLHGPGSRRDFFKKIGGAGLAGLAAPLLPGTAKGGTPEPAGSISNIKHIVFLVQENHSYDTYFGSYSKNPAGVGIPSGYTSGGHKPYHFSSLNANTTDINHDWTTIHNEWANGAMNGFYGADGIDSLGYYTSTDLAYYYSLLPKFTLCGGYHCSMLTETQPNRFCTMGATSGGNCGDSVPNGHYSSSKFPLIFDLLKEHNVTFKNYNWNEPANYFYAACFSNWAKGGPNNELNSSYATFQSDCKNGTLPGVSYVTNNDQEHPGSGTTGSISAGMKQMKTIISQIMASPNWANTAIFLTWDEGGGFFDHVKPPTIPGEQPGPTGFGSLGIRVPCLVISPYAKVGYVDTAPSEHSSVLKFIEKAFGLPTLASVNSTYNSSTPKDSYNQTNGAPFPPRDGQPLSIVSDMTQCFNFAQAPNLYPDVPGSPYYSGRKTRETSTLYTFGR